MNSVAPTISGTVQQGQTLTESHGTWSNTPTGYAYQWQQCDSAGANCTTISGANTQTYVPVAADVGHTLKVQETASNAGGSSAPATSTATSVVVPPAPVNSAAPTISGTAQQGQTLTESHGTWSNTPTGYAYQWQQCDSAGANCTTISGANAQTYVPVAADVGHTLRVQETASNAGGSSAPATSAATSVVVPPAPVNSAAPTISGTVQQGQTLTESHGTWSNTPTGYAYQWQQCDSAGANCTTISGANTQTYVPVAADVGHTLKVQETASNAGGSSTPAASAATSVVVPPAPVNSAAPTISGTAQQGQTLTESHGTWSNTPTGYAYQWQQCDSAGANCTTISGANAQTYVPVAADVGHTLRVQETASNAGGSSTPAASAATSVVVSGTSQDPVLAAVGDIACPGGDKVNSCKQLATASLTASQKPTAVAVLGDNQYESGLLSEFNSPGAYNATWGQFNPIVHPAPGNHEYAASSSASGYFTYFGSAAGNGNYSYELGSWHIISLNSDCSDSGCEDKLAGTTSTAAVKWLEGDLAAHPGQCVLAYWHHPLFSSGFVGNSPGVAPFWNALYAAHADVVLNGHDHLYERFAQQDSSQKATSSGIREFVIGTGGESLFSVEHVQPNLEAIDNEHFGVMFLTLHSGSYEWAFRATDGSLLDSGSSACHSQPKGASAAAPIRATATVAPHASAPAPLPAVLSAERLAPSAAPEQPLVFAVSPSPQPPAEAGTLPVEVHCSPACNLDITLQVGDTTVAKYRETEKEIHKPYTLLPLQLSPDAIRLIGHASLTATFVATDAANEVRSLTRTLTMAGP